MRVHIGIALMVLMLVLTLAGTAHGQEKDRNGYWWVNQTQEFRSGFVLGYAMAMGVNSDAAWLVPALSGIASPQPCNQIRVITRIVLNNACNTVGACKQK